MTSLGHLELAGQKLSLEDLARFAAAPCRLTLAGSARGRMEAGCRVVQRIIAENRVVYGVNAIIPGLR